MKVTLTWTEMMVAAQVGTYRNIGALKKGYTRKNDQPANMLWQQNIEGAMAECAIAKALGVYWTGVESFGPDTLGGDVRYTEYGNGRLIVQQDDDDNAQFWLVTGINGEYFVRGWMTGADAKQEKYWDDPQGRKDPNKSRPAYFVPQGELNPVETFALRTPPAKQLGLLPGNH
jgi:hypothetical protein